MQRLSLSNVNRYVTTEEAPIWAANRYDPAVAEEKDALKQREGPVV